MEKIRNFAIIAHVDHGKSTLADRLMEITGVVEKGRHEEQMLDRNPISRERGITIKLAPVRMIYKNSRLQIPNTKQIQNSNIPISKQFVNWNLDFDNSNLNYILNLIDTPGHVDFSYEVDRTLACVEGVILLVDATQGIQAQTIANVYKAMEKNLVIIPAINKIDLPSAQIEKIKKQLIDFLGIEEDEIYLVSAKTGQGVAALLEAVVKKIPSPKLLTNQSLSFASLIFDSYYDLHRGVIAFVRVFGGSVKKNYRLKLVHSQTQFTVDEVGYFTPDLRPAERLADGEIGYIVTNLKDIRQVRVGDTLTDAKLVNPPTIAGYKKNKPMVFASIFPTDPIDYQQLKKSLEKLYLNDSSLEFQGVYSQALGAGFRVGFLGLLHADVVRERLEREFNLSLVLTPPQVEFKINEKGKIELPVVRIAVITPSLYLSAVMNLCLNHNAKFITMNNIGQSDEVILQYEMLMSELMSDFFDQLKVVSSGFASLDWEFVDYQEVEADKLEIFLNDDLVEEFTQIVIKEKAYYEANQLLKKLRELIPRQQFEVRLQARFTGRIIASERVAPYRKNVLVKSGKVLGTGDISRKRKLLERQKEGKKRLKMIGKVEIPKEAFIQLFKKN
jgi:GTP-binding protein LepA